MAIVADLARPGHPVDVHNAARRDDITENFAITPSDTTVYTPPLRGITVHDAGDVVCVDREGNQNTFTVAAAGSMLIEGYFKKVMATDTTSTLIEGLR